MLVRCGSMEQMKACGLTSVKQQLKLKQLLSPQLKAEVPTHAVSVHGKLSMSAIKKLTPEERRLYLMK